MDERRKDDTDAERAAWMAAAQNGDAAAYASLLTSLLPVLRAFVRRRGVDASAVEDVVQEVLLLIHRARHTWRSDRPFDPWLWAIARNATTDALRRQLRERARRDRARTRPRPSRRPPRTIPRRGSPRASSPPGCARRSSVCRRRSARRWSSSYVEQVTVAEAAARAGVCATALKVRAHRGSRALRAALTRKDES